MKINLYHDAKDICHITVVGEIESLKEEMYFIEVVDEVKYKMLHITFLDANILGSKIIEVLDRLQRDGCLRMFVLKSYLFSYLYSLGIQSNFVASKSIANCRDEEDYKIDLAEVHGFLAEVKHQYGYDYTLYQIDSILRRIKACMLKENIKVFTQFREAVLQKEEVFEQLFLHFSVNTTEFFRNPEVFKELRHKVMPYLSTFPHIKIWCAGCSTGQEPYSLAILLKEMGLIKKTQIYATDINPFAIVEAQNGLYPLKGLEKNIRNYRNSGASGSLMDYFSIKGEYLEIQEDLKENILFFQHSLDGEGILNEFQLILCRNVLIYFTPELQRKVLANFAKSLDHNGFLILGKSEGILHNGGHEFFYDFHKNLKIYKGI